MPTIVPTLAGACYTIQFPGVTTTLMDFYATVNTMNVAHVAFFTAHMPTEFERDTRYFMTPDLATDVEPVSTLGAAAAHDHGRRLDERISNEFYSRNPDRRRRLADPGMCCNTTAQQGAWEIVVAYHDICAYNQVKPYIEIGFHDYEASCQNYFCNLVGPGVDQTTCVATGIGSGNAVAPTTVGGSDGALIGGVVGGVLGGLLLITVILIAVGCSREMQGKPIFGPVNPGAKAPTFEKADVASTAASAEVANGKI